MSMTDRLTDGDGPLCFRQTAWDDSLSPGRTVRHAQSSLVYTTIVFGLTPVSATTSIQRSGGIALLQAVHPHENTTPH